MFSWNAFHRHITEDTFYNVAEKMASNGMQAAGYEYVSVLCLTLRLVLSSYIQINTDAGWWNNTKVSKGHSKIYRNASGFPSWDPVTFPRGLPLLIDYIHSKGFKWG